jgi:C4-dicarboxylate transporter DctM subunit
MAVALSVVVHIETVRHGYGGSIAPATAASGGVLDLVDTRLVLTLLIVGGIRYGAFTATEAGAVAALYSVLCGVLIYRTADLASLWQALREAQRDRRCHDHHCGVGALCLRWSSSRYRRSSS